MIELSTPTLELAQRCVRELPWEGRLEGYWTHLMSGSTQHYMYNLPQVADFLRGNVEVLYERNGSVGYIDAASLRDWAKNMVGDDELAAAIEVMVLELANCENDVKRQRKEIEIIEPLGDLIRTRVQQCLKVLGDSVNKEEK